MEVEDRTFGEKVSDSVAIFGGSWWFIISGAIFITSWVVLNIAPFFEWIKWDEYPFILLNLFLSLIAAFQAPFILMAQRRVEIKQDLIYRSLFREIKELVEVDLSLEHEIVDKHKSIEIEMQEVKTRLNKIQNLIEKLINDKDI